MHSIIIVEDELIAAEYLKELLHIHGFSVLAIIDTGKEALAKIPQLSPDIVLMDIMLKDHISGSEVALQLKRTAPKTAIVFLTAYAESEMIDYAIESNAYGYLMKPYDEVGIISSLKVILARIKQHHSSNKPVRKKTFISQEYYFDHELNRLFYKGMEISLGKKSLNILSLLCKNPNITIGKNTLCLEIWGEEKSDAMLRTQISRTKKEMGIDVIKNSKGIGYKLICPSL